MERLPTKFYVWYKVEPMKPCTGADAGAYAAAYGGADAGADAAADEFLRRPHGAPKPRAGDAKFDKPPGDRGGEIEEKGELHQRVVPHLAGDERSDLRLLLVSPMQEEALGLRERHCRGQGRKVGDRLIPSPPDYPAATPSNPQAQSRAACLNFRPCLLVGS